MRSSALAIVLLASVPTLAAEVEVRALTHYVPQDLLETAVRTEGWTEVPLVLKGGLRKGDVLRIWAGGSIDRGNGDQPGVNINGPAGAVVPGTDPQKLALSAASGHSFAVLCKIEGPALHKCLPPGKPLEIKLTHDKERFWIGFNDEKGRFQDNHLGKGRRHELDPLWVRVEVIRITVD